MAVLLNPNLLITVGAIVVAALVASVLLTADKDAVERWRCGRRYHRDGRARHTVRPPGDADTAPLPALTTTPDSGPFTQRTM